MQTGAKTELYLYGYGTEQCRNMAIKETERILKIFYWGHSSDKGGGRSNPKIRPYSKKLL